MNWMEDPRLWSLIGRMITDHQLRKEIMQKGLNGYLKEQGVDIAPIEIDLEVDPATGGLLVKVKNSGQNFKGHLTVEMTK